jgi:hypothetical protein
LKECGSSPTWIVHRGRGHRDPKEANTLRLLPVLLGRGWQLRGGDCSRLQRREVRLARGRACGCGVVCLDGSVAFL